MTQPKPPLGLARSLRYDLYALTVGRPIPWVQVHELGLRHPHSAIPTLEAAVALAIARGWMTGQGEPVQAVSLTEEGRRLSAKERKQS